MSTLIEIEESIRNLSPEEREAFRAWFAEFDAADWDRKLEQDVASGKLDWLADEAREALNRVAAPIDEPSGNTPLLGVLSAIAG